MFFNYDHILVEIKTNLQNKENIETLHKKTFDKISIGVFNISMQRPHPEIVCTSLSRNIKAIMSLSNRGWNLISSNFLQRKQISFQSCQSKKR